MIRPLVRIALSVVTVCFAILAVAETLDRPHLGTYGLPVRDEFMRGGPLTWQIERVPRNSAIEKAGIVPGDRVQLDSPYDVFRRGNALAGDQLAVRIVHAGVARDATLIAQPLPPPRDLNGLLRVVDDATPWVRLATQLAMYGLALFLIAEQWRNIAARSLIVFLISFAYSLQLTAPFTLLSGGALIAAHFALNLSIVIALAAVMRFATAFPNEERPDLDLDGIRHAIRRIAPFFALIMAIDTLLEIGPQYAFGYYEPLTDKLWWACWAYALSATIVALFIASRCAVGNDHSRFLYVTATFLVGFAGPIVVLVGVILGFNYDALARLRLTAIVIPVGFGYAMLRHHVLDAYFVLNRAVIYSLISALVLPIIGLSEALSKEALSGGNEAGALSGGLALVAFFVLQNFREKAAEFVDAVFFRRRLLVERAIRLAIEEMAFIDDANRLFDRVVTTIAREFNTHGVAVYVREGEIFRVRASSFADAPDISVDDDAVLRMETRHQPLATSEVTTAAPGILLLPATPHGRVRAFVACGYRNTDQRYDRDEHQLLEEFALGFGLSLDHLQLREYERERMLAPAPAGAF